MGRRVLVTGLASFWGGRVAKALEADPTVDVIVGLDTREPSIELERTEFVRTDENYSILSRIVSATQVDTIVHTFLVVDSTTMSARATHEINVIGTMNLFAAAHDTSSVRNVVVKSSAYVYGSDPRDPVWFSEETPRLNPPRHRIERSLSEVESYVHDFAVDNPHVAVSLLRFSNVLGTEITTPLSNMLAAPVVPSVFGFDPRFQFVHEDDVIRAVLHVLDEDLDGVFNVAGDGLLTWSEVASICGKRTMPLPPIGQGLVAAGLRRLGLDIPPEVVDLLSYGRGIDNRRLKQTGFEYSHTSAGTVKSFIEALRLRKTVGPDIAYRYEPEVEGFFRRSPAVVRNQPNG